MTNMIVRCARTGVDVQVQLPDVLPTDRSDIYETVTCPACARIHFVNKKTGRLLSDHEKRDAAPGRGKPCYSI